MSQNCSVASANCPRLRVNGRVQFSCYYVILKLNYSDGINHEFNLMFVKLCGSLHHFLRFLIFAKVILLFCSVIVFIVFRYIFLNLIWRVVGKLAILQQRIVR